MHIYEKHLLIGINGDLIYDYPNDVKKLKGELTQGVNVIK